MSLVVRMLLDDWREGPAHKLFSVLSAPLREQNQASPAAGLERASQSWRSMHRLARVVTVGARGVESSHTLVEETARVSAGLRARRARGTGAVG